MKNLALHWKIIIGLLLGVIWALVAAYLGWSEFTINWIGPFGTIFINLLKLIAVPLVLFSIIKGVTGLQDISRLGNMGVKTLLMYLLTTVIAVSSGLLLVNTVAPGKLIAESQRMENRKDYERFAAAKEGVELLDDRQVLPDEAFAGEEERIEPDPGLEEKLKAAREVKEESPLQFLIDFVPDNIFKALTDIGLMLQVIFFALFFGIALLMIPSEKSGSVINLIDGLNEVFLKMVDLVMKGAPFFVFALLAGKMAEMAGDNPGQIIEIFKGLGWYSLTVVAGLALLAFVIYPLVMMLVVKNRSYGDFFWGIGPAQMLAFSTSSSAATLPVTIECVQDRLGVSKEVSSFVLPIGATVNMDGTSLYQAVAVMFLAQLHMVDLTLAQQLTIVLTATLASIGSAAVPSAGLVMLIIVLEAVGLDPAWIAIIFPVDRILDMARTVVNVTGDAMVSSVIAKTEGQLNPVNRE